MNVLFTIPGEPQGKGRPRFAKIGGFVRTYTPDKTVAYENLVKLEYERQCGPKRFKDDEMLELRIIAFYGIPKSASQKKKEKMISGEIRPAKKPDMDNIVKVIADSLNGLAYRDDVQIVDSTIKKYYAEKPMVKVMIMTAKNN